MTYYSLYFKEPSGRVRFAFVLEQTTDDAAWTEAQLFDREECGVELWQGERLVGCIGSSTAIASRNGKPSHSSSPAWHRIAQVVA